jgi:hypothetical protein
MARDIIFNSAGGLEKCRAAPFPRPFFLICVRVELLTSLFSTQKRLFMRAEMRTKSGGDATGVQFKKPLSAYV